MSTGRKSRKLLRKLQNFFTPLKSEGYTPVLEEPLADYAGDFPGVSWLIRGNTPEDIARRNHQKLEVAKLEQERDAINKNLTAQHRVMIATLAAALTALVLGVLGTVRQPKVIIQDPTPKVYVNVTRH